MNSRALYAQHNTPVGACPGWICRIQQTKAHQYLHVYYTDVQLLRTLINLCTFNARLDLLYITRGMCVLPLFHLMCRYTIYNSELVELKRVRDRFNPYNIFILSTGSISLLQAGQEKKQVQLPGASNFCPWASGNRSLVARWTSKIRLGSLVSLSESVSLVNDSFQSETSSTLTDDDKEQDQASMVAPFPQLLDSDTDTE